MSARMVSAALSAQAEVCPAQLVRERDIRVVPRLLSVREPHSTAVPAARLLSGVGTHVWFVDEPEHVMRIEDLPERTDG